MKKLITILSLLSISLATVAKADDYVLCRFHGASHPVIKINTKDLEVGKCPVVLPSRLTDFQFRVSRHQNSGLLRIVVKNEKNNFWMRSLGGNNEVDISLGLSDSDGRDAANQLGLTGSKIDELHVGCGPSFGFDSDSYLLVTAPSNCAN